MSKHTVNILKIIAFTEFLLGLTLLFRDIIHCIHSPTAQMIDSQFSGLVELFKYKESYYRNLYLYSLIAITGLSFWINRRLYWGLTQILFITLFFVINLKLWSVNLYNLGVNICITSLLLFLFLYIEVKICNSLILEKIGITKTVKYLCFCGGGLSCIIWFVLFCL